MKNEFLFVVMVKFSANVSWGVYSFTQILKITTSEEEAYDLQNKYMSIEDPIERNSKLIEDFFSNTKFVPSLEVDDAPVVPEIYYAWYDGTMPIEAGGAFYLE